MMLIKLAYKSLLLVVTLSAEKPFWLVKKMKKDCLHMRNKKLCLMMKQI